MICSNCNSQSSHIVADRQGNESCHVCGEFGESKGKSTSGIITRNSHRIEVQRDRGSGDFIQPHVYDKNKRKLDVNPDFVKRYGTQTSEYFSDTELNAAGLHKLPKAAAKKKAAQAKAKLAIQKDVVHSGSAKKGMERVLA